MHCAHFIIWLILNNPFEAKEKVTLVYIFPPIRMHFCMSKLDMEEFSYMYRNPYIALHCMFSIHHTQRPPIDLHLDFGTKNNQLHVQRYIV